MKLLSWNVNGLRAICEKNALQWLKDEKFDFVGFQEIKASEDKFPKGIYELDFKFIFSNSAQRAGYSGVMSLCDFECETKKCEFAEDNEGRVLEHRLKTLFCLIFTFQMGKKTRRD